MHKGPSTPSTVLKYSPDTCDIFVVSIHKVTKKLSTSTSSRGGYVSLQPAEAIFEDKRVSWCSTPAVEQKLHKIVRASSLPKTSCSNSAANIDIQVEKLRLELQTTRASYDQACKDLAHAQNKVRPGQLAGISLNILKLAE
ncbi:hypothetical protein Dimus_002716 [Dionaea muscipula]